MADTDGTTDPMVPRLARIARRRRDGPQVWTLEIEAEDSAGAGFAPGQFNMLTAFGVGEVPISLSGDPAEPDRLVHTIRAVGPVSTALTRLGPGETVGLRGPFGVGWPMAELAGHDVLIVAGGLGLAPLRPVLYRLLAERARYGKVVLLYGTRSPQEILFRRQIESWRRRLDIDIEVTVDHALGDWHGHVGVVTTLIPRASFDPAHTIALVCGPEVMMRFAIAALRDAGLPDTALFLSMERNMKCAVGLCGHCQIGPVFACRDGPVFRFDRLRNVLAVKEI
ncbi:MAG: FAD/NAD(P)-binding protein [Acidobacteriia bacterium]|nr:FAD/NAD(P)-binding protein [Methyloceanibacter sp.]MBX5471730.1 FAD/NAD(P)-binding protein [Acetobacteraceae bacterium]MCL6492385.1 FAD/NAD(P)-binding protein [Terriglobia bacterium]